MASVEWTDELSQTCYCLHEHNPKGKQGRDGQSGKGKSVEFVFEELAPCLSGFFLRKRNFVSDEQIGGYDPPRYCRCGPRVDWQCFGIAGIGVAFFGMLFLFR